MTKTWPFMADPDTDAARLARHRDLHRTVHPDVAAAAAEAARHRVMVEAVNTDAEIRRKLIDLGWRPPSKPVDQPQVPTRAYLHATSDDCVTTDPTAYAQGRPLVLQADVRDHVEWLEAGIDEWRQAALRAEQRLRDAIRHLQRVTDTQVTATQALQAREDAGVWLDNNTREPV